MFAAREVSKLLKLGTIVLIYDRGVVRLGRNPGLKTPSSDKPRWWIVSSSELHLSQRAELGPGRGLL